MTGSLHGRRSAGKQKDRQRTGQHGVLEWRDEVAPGCSVGGRMWSQDGPHSLRGEKDAELQAAARVRAGLSEQDESSTGESVAAPRRGDVAEVLRSLVVGHVCGLQV